MPFPSHLIEHGVLYEGSDFRKWTKKIQGLWHVHGLNTSLSLHPIGVGEAHQAQKLGVMKAIIRPTLLKRVPDAKRRLPSDLWSALKAAAQPFRLMDLPFMVRHRIYHKIIHGRVRWGRSKNADYHRAQGLLQSCRAIRQEAQPIFYRMMEFVFDFDHTKTSIEDLRHWGTEIVGDHLGLIRKLTVNVIDVSITFEYDPENRLTWPMSGLPLEFDYLALDSKTMLYNHFEGFEAYALATDLEGGECIFLAVTMRPELWYTLQFKSEDESEED